MALVLLLGGFGLLALPACARRFGRRLAPPEWARLSATLLAAGAGVVWVFAGLLAAPTLLRAAGIHHLAQTCERVLAPLTPGGTPVGWSALTVAVSLPLLMAVGAARTWRARRRFHIEPGLGAHRPYGHHVLVVLPADEPLALSVPGSPSQIIVSQGLVERLSPRELAAVVRHEAVHLDHGHEHFLTLAAALEHAFFLVPFVTRSTRTLRTALERWADEVAAGETGAERMELREALLGVTTAVVDPTVAAFGAAETVIERLEALDGGVRRPSILGRVAVYLPTLAVSAVALVAVAVWAGDVSSAFATPGSCPA